jgi:hypothetical protein
VTMKASLLHHHPRHAPLTIDPTDTLRRLWRDVQTSLARRAAARNARPRLGMLGIPLAIVASLLSQSWWCLPGLALCAWWWAPPSRGWEWIVAVGRGLIGAEWVFVGSSALARFPDDVLLVGAFWTLGAGVLGVLGFGATGHSDIHIGALARRRRAPAVQMRRSGAPAIRRRFAMHVANGSVRGRNRRTSGN